jgi:hypothetical protein
MMHGWHQVHLYQPASGGMDGCQSTDPLSGRLGTCEAVGGMCVRAAAAPHPRVVATSPQPTGETIGGTGRDKRDYRAVAVRVCARASEKVNGAGEIM